MCCFKPLTSLPQWTPTPCPLRGLELPPCVCTLAGIQVFFFTFSLNLLGDIVNTSMYIICMLYCCHPSSWGLVE